jgi:hypothetical protein
MVALSAAAPLAPLPGARSARNLANFAVRPRLFPLTRTAPALGEIRRVVAVAVHDKARRQHLRQVHPAPAKSTTHSPPGDDAGPRVTYHLRSAAGVGTLLVFDGDTRPANDAFPDHALSYAVNLNPAFPRQPRMLAVQAGIGSALVNLYSELGRRPGATA